MDGAAAALTSAYAIPILFYLVYTLPLAAIGVVVYRRARVRETACADEVARIVGLACLALLANSGMLRDPLDVRIADVLVLPAIVGAWLIGVACGGQGWTWARLRDQWSALRGGDMSTRSAAHAVFRGGSALAATLVLRAAWVAASPALGGHDQRRREPHQQDPPRQTQREALAGRPDDAALGRRRRPRSGQGVPAPEGTC